MERVVSLRLIVVAAVTALGLAASAVPASASDPASPANRGCSLPVVGPVCAPDTVVLDGKQLLRTKIALLLGDRTDRTAFANLKKQADAALTTGPWSVTSKTQVPPSGDKHDY